MSAADDYPIIASQVVHTIPYAAPETLNYGEYECFKALREIDALRAELVALRTERSADDEAYEAMLILSPGETLHGASGHELFCVHDDEDPVTLYVRVADYYHDDPDPYADRSVVEPQPDPSAS